MARLRIANGLKRLGLCKDLSGGMFDDTVAVSGTEDEVVLSGDDLQCTLELGRHEVHHW